MSTPEIAWMLIGFAGQACYAGRMVLQWWVSEREGRSVVPLAFWHMSVVGGVMMLAYAAWRRDPVFGAGQILSLAIYLRNLKLHRGADSRSLQSGRRNPPATLSRRPPRRLPIRQPRSGTASTFRRCTTRGE